MSFDEIFDLTAGVYFNFYNKCLHGDFMPQTQKTQAMRECVVFTFV